MRPRFQPTLGEAGTGRHGPPLRVERPALARPLPSLLRTVLGVALSASLWPGPAHAKDIQAAARQAYRACLKETAAARSTCTFGGCGYVVATCTDRQVAVYERDSEALAQAIAAAGDRCAEAADGTAKEIDALQERLLGMPPWHETWSGLEWGVEVAAFKNRSLRLLLTACVPDPVLGSVPPALLRKPGAASRDGPRPLPKGPSGAGRPFP
jgi:hypothetical protein